LRWSYDFCPWFCFCAVLHLLICICWTILLSLEWNQFIKVYALFNVLLNLVCKYFIENVWIYVHQGN
jgi:hypothetical protein